MTRGQLTFGIFGTVVEAAYARYSTLKRSLSSRTFIFIYLAVLHLTLNENKGGLGSTKTCKIFRDGRLYPRYRLRPSAVASRTRSWIDARARSFRVRLRRPGCDRAARSSAIGTEDAALRNEPSEERRVGRSWKGAAPMFSWSALLSASKTECASAGSATADASSPSSVGTRTSWKFVLCAALSMLQDVRGTVSRVVCDVISV